MIGSSYRSRSRRLLMPLIIVATALLVGYISTRRDAERMNAIQKTVLSLCGDAAAGKDVSSQIDAGGVKFVSDSIAAELTNICQSASSPQAISVAVLTGDDKLVGDGTASHTARISIDGHEALGLRIHYGSDGSIKFVGYWKM
jgi:hypothetical protein